MTSGVVPVDTDVVRRALWAAVIVLGAPAMVLALGFVLLRLTVVLGAPAKAIQTPSPGSVVVSLIMLPLIAGLIQVVIAVLTWVGFASGAPMRSAEPAAPTQSQIGVVRHGT